MTKKEFDIVISGHFRTLGMFILKNYRCWVLLFCKARYRGKILKQIFLGIAFDFYFQGYPVWFIALSQIAKYGSFKV